MRLVGSVNARLTGPEANSAPPRWRHRSRCEPAVEHLAFERPVERTVRSQSAGDSDGTERYVVMNQARVQYWGLVFPESLLLVATTMLGWGR